MKGRDEVCLFSIPFGLNEHISALMCSDFVRRGQSFKLPAFVDLKRGKI